jgi:eukaryotic-like serine/threonine-protein kinase
MRFQLAIFVVLLGCAGSKSVSPKGPGAGSPGEARPGFSDSSAMSGRIVGTSDGVTCEDARDRNVEEIDMQGGSSPDLSAGDLGSVLNNGAYMTPCDVPGTSRVQICVAVRAGQAVGVTVALAPSNPDVELCVAKQVRGLSFPPNPKMDIAVVRF